MSPAGSSQSLTRFDAITDSNPLPAGRALGAFATIVFVLLAGLAMPATVIVTSLLWPVHGAPAAALAASPSRQLRATTPALVSAASGVLPLGGISVTLPVSVSNVANLGAVTVELAYDNLLVAPVRDSCTINRNLFSGGTCNLRLDRNNDGIPDTVRFNVYSSTESGVSVPANAPLAMVTISWVATTTATVGMTSPLTVTVFDPAGPDGVVMPPFTTQNGQIVIAAATPAPTATFAPTATPNTPVTSTPAPTSPTTPESTPTGAVYLPVVASP